MRYGDGGGVDQAERARREQVRQRAAQLFADGKSAVEVATLSEVSTKSAYQWRRAWVTGGAKALASKGPSGPAPKLSDEQLARCRWPGLRKIGTAVSGSNDLGVESAAVG